VDCTLGTLAGGASATVTVVVTVAADAALCNTTITNSVSVATTTDQSTPADNTDTENTLVVCTNFAVTKSDSKDQIRREDDALHHMLGLDHRKVGAHK